MADPEYAFSPFTGPIKDRQGNLRVPSLVRLALEDLITMEWAAEGIAGPWPGEPEREGRELHPRQILDPALLLSF